MVEMRVRGLAVDAGSRQPVVILWDTTESRFLPIWTGVFESEAILLALEEIKVPRPSTHDLMKSLLEKLGAKLDRVVIHHVDEKISTYYTNLVISRPGQPELEIDARPSDAVALALRMSAPIFVSEEVLSKSSVQDKVKMNKELDDFRKFLSEVKPEDFARYDRRPHDEDDPEKQ
jgi:bifunctional DNase/RNase